ncbi:MULTISPECIES: hypothetical protein [Archaeoglobus]|jgi:uncharacterized protein YutE (UPF0331/DUF86 family)|uniref:Uncharacterized protein AF_1860 n=3 Tax=Archaeoglobus fulgidus TaxID=2234 RepID=Y1860_ARCFU|nr:MULTISPECIES: hypothetical protein [Archaeoglobus]O28419.1 RecName: Full=Uncharacterized protein AF_1860 [Archaeoglobus fulgidus DSM 4304]AAB89397.1 predicted coding region AF_1860 [Archaeoglobus fulgidus DSM 4304]AIG98857.1 hypothetical protein AFULGI_00021150 [Archaeoglobus fulgidus DSM 8774]KUJ93045.1 MAG: hypothetical protein XD40_1772 [Archaeoglobus fulgidus]KUK06589.1 MAG: Uncharacterized protein XD48_1189 [Archaeoglobus fulgidus]MDI3497477.1 hypothetical protein [Archaeoglobus sp.]
MALDRVDRNIIEGKIDIIETAHIISSLGLERAESYSEMFEILGKTGIIVKNSLQNRF